MEYDAELIVNEQSLEPPLVFRKAGLTGSLYISAVVDDIPHGLKLNESEKYVVRHLEKTPYLSDIRASRKEIIRLSYQTEQQLTIMK